MRILLPLLLLPGCLCSTDPDGLVPETVTEDPSLPSIEINGTHLHAEAFGDPEDPVVLVLHGGPGSDYREFLPLAALADDGYYVAFFDQRGCGLSERHDPVDIDLDLYLEDLRQVIEHYAPDRPFVVIAQSWGAMYATAFIDTYGDLDGRFRGAVFTEPGAFTSAQLDAFMARLQASIPLGGEQLNDAFWSAQFVSKQDHERADYAEALFAIRGAPSEHRDPDNLSPLWRPGAIAKQRLFEIAKQGFDWTTHLDAYPHHVLFLRGELNTATPLEQQQELAAAYPDATIETIEGVGHKVIWERTDEYLTHVRAYLRGIGYGP